jgi:hypothetical protein
MAQFSHADFGGMSQWSPGMSMVGDMFNTRLKAKLDGLCSDLADHLSSAGAPDKGRDAGDEVSYRSATRSSDWWPEGLGRPGAVGSQNDLRYAVFPESSWLVIDDQGTISIYDTGRHHGVSPTMTVCEPVRPSLRRAMPTRRGSGLPCSRSSPHAVAVM